MTIKAQCIREARKIRKENILNEDFITKKSLFWKKRDELRTITGGI